MCVCVCVYVYQGSSAKAEKKDPRLEAARTEMQAAVEAIQSLEDDSLIDLASARASYPQDEVRISWNLPWNVPWKVPWKGPCANTVASLSDYDPSTPRRSRAKHLHHACGADPQRGEDNGAGILDVCVCVYIYIS